MGKYKVIVTSVLETFEYESETEPNYEVVNGILDVIIDNGQHVFAPGHWSHLSIISPLNETEE